MELPIHHENRAVGLGVIRLKASVTASINELRSNANCIEG